MQRANKCENFPGTDRRGEAWRAETRGPKGRDARPEGPRREARRAESGGGVLGEGQPPLPTS